MKNIIYFIASLLSITASIALYAQPADKTFPLEITSNKTATVVFSSSIRSVDRGSRDILAQKAKEVNNILQVKAARKDFPETNLTVITSDGQLYQFVVTYCSEPSTLVTSVDATGIEKLASRRVIFSTEMTETDLVNYSEGIIASKRLSHFSNTSKYKVSLSLLGIYIKENVIFYRVRIRNRSNISYDIDFLKFFIRDNAKIKRTASQEIEERPMFIYHEVSTIKGTSEAEMVFALEKFTIPESKHLALELFEHKGGRHFQLKIKNNEIVNARLLN